MDIKQIEDRLAQTLVYGEAGKVTKCLGLLYEAYLPGASVGSVCRIYSGGVQDQKENFVDAEVIGFKDKKIILMPYEESVGINNDSLVVLQKRTSTFHLSAHLLGRVIDARGHPLDGLGPLAPKGAFLEERSLYHKPEHPLQRQMISKPLDLGIRSINGLLTCGRGQRVGIMAGSGVGKSVLLGMMARHTQAHVNVIGLIGERGREVKEFIERDLGPEGLRRSVVIVATSDQSPLLRMRGAFLAATIAEFFRDQGQDVLWLMDSITRFCMAQREIGLSMGEPPASKGYTPSVFSLLPKLLERAGTSSHHGTITGLFTVLVEGDEMDDPVADSARSILDGHLVLSRKIAQRNQFPAIDVLQSTSRVMRAVVSPEHQKLAAQIREWIAIYAQVEDLINLGAYAKGVNVEVDQAVLVHDRIKLFLRQEMDEKATLENALLEMRSILRLAESQVSAQQSPTKTVQKVSSNLTFS